MKKASSSVFALLPIHKIDRATAFGRMCSDVTARRSVVNYPLNTKIGSPVSCRIDGKWKKFPLKFLWHCGPWFELFERHADYIKQEIARRRAEGRRIVYLSCPVSAKGGGFTTTNVEIAVHVTNALEKLFGTNFWILNPALYQMESRAGVGLIERHAHALGIERGAAIDLDLLRREQPLCGGDYLRMWTRVLAEDGRDNLGDHIDAIYFMGPSDAWGFFSKDRENVLDGVENYLARKIVLDPEYHEYFSDVTHGALRRTQFIEYYTLKVGAAFSYGSQDELDIWDTLCALRIGERGLPSQIPAFSEGRQLNLLYRGSGRKGYAV